MTTEYRGYTGRTPSQAAAEGDVLSEAEAIAFELAARRAALDLIHRRAVEAGQDCEYHPGFGHGFGKDPRYYDSDIRQRAAAKAEDEAQHRAKVDALYDPDRV